MHNDLKAHLTKALYASLFAAVRTMLRAELYASIMAITHTVKSQFIICDHANHVDALHDIAVGVTKALIPKMLNLDL